MANFTDWVYDTLKSSPLGQRADENWAKRQQGAGPAISIPGVNWAAIDASRSPPPVPAYQPGMLGRQPSTLQLARAAQAAGFQDRDGYEVASDGSLTRGGNVQTAAIPRVPGPNGTTNLTKNTAQLASSDPRLWNAPGDPRLGYAGENTQSPGISAITAAMRPSSSWLDQFLQRMQWQPAAPAGPAPSGDPWASSRIGAQDQPLPGYGAGPQGNRAPPPIPPRRLSPEVHARLLAQQEMQNPAAQAAINKGKSSYTSSNGSGVLAVNALMPTKTISGAIRRTYGD